MTSANAYYFQNFKNVPFQELIWMAPLPFFKFMRECTSDI